jgi:hypothetical protein
MIPSYVAGSMLALQALKTRVRRGRTAMLASGDRSPSPIVPVKRWSSGGAGRWAKDRRSLHRCVFSMLSSGRLEGVFV